jgi:hypothetical protein
MKFVIKWYYFGQLFLGIGFIISKNRIGITLLNLFIGSERYEIDSAEDF